MVWDTSYGLLLVFWLDGYGTILKYFEGKRYKLLVSLHDIVKVLELGAGPGLASLAAGEYAKRVVATDYLEPVCPSRTVLNPQQILHMIETNARENNVYNVTAQYLNWEDLQSEEQKVEWQ